MYGGAITQWLKQLEAGQLCLQQLQSRGKGGLFCSLAKATAEFSPPLIKYFLLSDTESPAQRRGERGRVRAFPLPIPDPAAEQQAKVCFCSSSTTGRRAPLNPRWCGQQLCRLEASWGLALPTRSRLPPKSSVTKH